MKPYRVLLSIVFAGSLLAFPGARRCCHAAVGGESVKAAQDLIASLPPELRKQAIQPFASEKRTDWHYFPREREGVAIGDLSEATKELLWGLIGKALSTKGVEAAKGVLTLEQVLKDIEKSDSRDPNKFHLAFWGEPSESEPWGWRFEGHHLSINATFEGANLVSITPTFLGANPAKVADGPWAGFRNLPNHEDLAQEFIQSLGKERKEKVLQPDEPSDLTSAGAAKVDPPLGIGLAVSELEEDQQALFGELLEVYLRAFRDSIRKELSLETDLVLRDPKLEIQWWGGMSPGEPHSYRITGTLVDIQFATRGDDANHVHTLVRVPGGDFGK